MSIGTLSYSRHRSGLRRLFAFVSVHRPSPLTLAMLIFSIAAVAAGDSCAAGQDRESTRTHIIIAEHVTMWDDEIVTWDEIVAKMREMRKDGPLYPAFHFTRGAFQTDGKYALWNAKISEVYGELFAPRGMSIGGMSSRGSLRYDRVRTVDDLKPQPEHRMTGQVLTPDGAPAADAQVAILPISDTSGVALSDGRLRDPQNEYWVVTDRQGAFEMYPDESNFFVCVMHESGFAMQMGPLDEEDSIISLDAWATMTFDETGQDEGQHASLRIQPSGTIEAHIDFIVYEVRVMEDDVTVKIPAGMVTVSRSIEMDDNSSISLPVETLRAEAGKGRAYSLAPPSDEDRRQAERFRIR